MRSFSMQFLSEDEYEPPISLFYNCRLFREGKIVKDDLWVREGKVIDPATVRFKADEKIDCFGGILAPGFIDLQVNGAFGVDFLTHPNLEEGLRYVRKRMPETGTTDFCPTLITSPPEFFRKTLPKIPPTCGSAVGGAGVAGVHLEGPFISVEKKGAHPAEYIVSPVEGFESVKKMYGEENLKNVAIVTLAPENERSEEVIRELTSRGIVVSLGHSVTDLETAEKAVAAGASKITHLFNAMPAFHHRDPSLPGLLVNGELDDSPTQRELFFGIISDGIHTHPAALRIAHAMRRSGLILVTDAIGAMGLPPGEYKLGKTDVIVGGDPLHAVVKGSEETLAGSVATLDFCVRYFREATGCSIEHVLRAVTTRPARCLGLEKKKGTLAIGSDADCVLLDNDLYVQATYIGGELCYSAVQSPSLSKLRTTRSIEGSTAAGSHSPCSPSIEDL